MMFNSIFKIIYSIEFSLIVIVRKIYTTKYREIKLIIVKKNTLDLVFLTLNGIGMIVPLFYVFSSYLDFANYFLPRWTGWLGALIFAIAIWLLYRSHADLGKSWTPTLGIQDDHLLITNGIYKYIRHPMYAAHIYWALAQILMLHNWIAGYSFIIVLLPYYILRVKKEEEMMIDQFGDQYKDYMKYTGRIFPRIWK